MEDRVNELLEEYNKDNARIDEEEKNKRLELRRLQRRMDEWEEVRNTTPSENATEQSIKEFEERYQENKNIYDAAKADLEDFQKNKENKMGENLNTLITGLQELHRTLNKEIMDTKRKILEAEDDYNKRRVSQDATIEEVNELWNKKGLLEKLLEQKEKELEKCREEIDKQLEKRIEKRRIHETLKMFHETGNETKQEGAKPEETKPEGAKPVEEKPVAKPVEEKPVEKPVEEQLTAGEIVKEQAKKPIDILREKITKLIASADKVTDHDELWNLSKELNTEGCSIDELKDLKNELATKAYELLSDYDENWHFYTMLEANIDLAITAMEQEEQQAEETVAATEPEPIEQEQPEGAKPEGAKPAPAATKGEATTKTKQAGKDDLGHVEIPLDEVKDEAEKNSKGIKLKHVKIENGTYKFEYANGTTKNAFKMKFFRRLYEKAKLATRKNLYGITVREALAMDVDIVTNIPESDKQDYLSFMTEQGEGDCFTIEYKDKESKHAQRYARVVDDWVKALPEGRNPRGKKIDNKAEKKEIPNAPKGKDVALDNAERHEVNSNKYNEMFGQNFDQRGKVTDEKIKEISDSLKQILGNDQQRNGQTEEKLAQTGKDIRE